MLSRLRKGDQVTVTAGRERGALGEIQRIIRGSDGKISHVLVEGVNKRICHTRPNPTKNEPGGKISKERKISAANVMPYHPDLKRGTRIRAKVHQDNSKIRLAVIDGKELP